MTYNKQNGADQPNVDPLAIFLADPDSHFADILHINFRLYKKGLLYDFFVSSLRELAPSPSSTLYLVDVGASMGFDIAYLLRRLTNCFKKPVPWLHTKVLLVEGDPDPIAKGKNFWKNMIKDTSIEFKYSQSSLVGPLPLKDRECDIIVCSEVTEHLDTPQVLLKEIYRALKPGGFLLFTTDNSPNFLHMVRRIPALLQGKYHKKYKRPKKEDTIVKSFILNKKNVPIYGHINLQNTQYWERQLKDAGFRIYSFGTYKSIRRGGGKTPLAITFYFMLSFLVSLLPRRIGRFFGDTTAILLRKPA